MSMADSPNIEEMRQVHQRALCPKWQKSVLKNPLTHRLFRTFHPDFKNMLLKCASDLTDDQITGSEIEYEPQIWNQDDVKNRFNCYDYAFNNRWSRQNRKTQPGELSQKYDIDKRAYTCRYFDEMVKSDHPNMIKTTYNKKCPKGHYKVALILDVLGQDKDYHFIRQDKNGKWSHKPGYQNVRDVDASNYPIVIPHLANHNYKTHNYSKFCDYYCIKDDAWKEFQKNERD